MINVSLNTQVYFLLQFLITISAVKIGHKEEKTISWFNDLSKKKKQFVL